MRKKSKGIYHNWYIKQKRQQTEHMIRWNGADIAGWPSTVKLTEIASKISSGVDQSSPKPIMIPANTLVSCWTNDSNIYLPKSDHNKTRSFAPPQVSEYESELSLWVDKYIHTCHKKRSHGCDWPCLLRNKSIWTTIPQSSEFLQHPMWSFDDSKSTFGGCNTIEKYWAS